MRRATLGPALRAAVTVLVMVAVVWLGQWEVPAGWLAAPRALREASPGLTPLFGAFMAVELAAFMVPRWRALRRDGRHGRAQLRTASLRLGVASSALYLLGVVMFVPVHGGALVLLALVHMSLLFGLATVLDRFGLGLGFATVFVCSEAGDLVTRLTVAAPAHWAVPVVLTTMCGVTFWNGGGAFQSSPPWPVPISGVVALSWPLQAIQYLDPHGNRLVSSAADVGVATAITVALALLLAQVVARLPTELRYIGTWPRRRRDALAWSLLVIGFLSLMTYAFRIMNSSHPHSAESGIVQPLILALLAALLLDLVVDWTARARKGPIVDVWEEPRGWAIPVGLAALALEGIEGIPRGVHVHALHQVFAPHFATRIAVRTDQAERARQVLADTFDVDADASPPTAF
jgi:hypothetical protein